MKQATNIPSGYSTAQAAALLGVDTHEVTRLFRTGVLAGQKIAGGALVLDPEGVQAYSQAPRLQGRPWDARTAWAALLLLDGGDISWLPYHRRRRLMQRLATVSAEELVWLARKRMTAARYRVSGSFAEGLKSSLTLTGMSSSAASDLGLVASPTKIDGYAADADKTVADFYLLADVTGSCIVRTATDAPPGLLDKAEMPTSIVAADLATSLDARERRCGLEHLEGVLDGVG